MSNMEGRSMYHKNRTLLITGFPDTVSSYAPPAITVVEVPEVIYPLAEETDPFPSDPFPTDPNAFEEIQASNLNIVPSKDNWFKRHQDGKLFRTMRSSRGRVELQSDCGTFFDTAILEETKGWKSVSPTSLNTYCRIPSVK